MSLLLAGSISLDSTLKYNKMKKVRLIKKKRTKVQNRKTGEDPNLKDMEKTNYKVLLKRWIESGFNKTLGLPLVADVLVLNVHKIPS